MEGVEGNRNQRVDPLSSTLPVQQNERRPMHQGEQQKDNVQQEGMADKVASLTRRLNLHGINLDVGSEHGN